MSLGMAWREMEDRCPELHVWPRDPGRGVSLGGWGFRALWLVLQPSHQLLSHRCPECHPCPVNCFGIRWSLIWQDVHSQCATWKRWSHLLNFRSRYAAVQFEHHSCMRCVQPERGRENVTDPIEASEVFFYWKDLRALLVVWLWVTF